MVFRLIVFLFIFLLNSPSNDTFDLYEKPQPNIGLKPSPQFEASQDRLGCLFDHAASSNLSVIVMSYNCSNPFISLAMTVSKADLFLFDVNSHLLNFTLSYTSSLPLLISLDTDLDYVANIDGADLLRLPETFNEKCINSSLVIQPNRIGITFLRIWVRVAKDFIINNEMNRDFVEYFHSKKNMTLYIDLLRLDSFNSSSTPDFAFKLVVLRHKGVLQKVFRFLLIGLVILVTFAMGCQLDLKVIFLYIKKPVAPAIGFASQFIIMPLVSANVPLCLHCL
ncbi:unnamed protein product [Protopolystoma xenopodis]|uniref:SSD domain-containing protein n=1 Tax=Protopolystoma xenopodis TaxID=117903 RepID=A0A3S5CJ47_9PLAT|nr:unnamed protein product [Protopolystoma xenopodis]